MGFRTTVLILLCFSRVAWAQDPPRFSPPKPPPLDQDFDDPNDEEEGDSPTRAGVPAPPSGTSSSTAAPTPPPSTDFHSAAAAPDANKVKFKVVEGEYYEKGKKRGRTPINKRTQ